MSTDPTKAPDADPPALSDFQLMALVREGRRDAFAEIVRRHQRMLVNFFVRMNADLSSAEDLAQTTFLRLYEYRERYRPVKRGDAAEATPFRAFLHTLAYHAWVDWRRKEERRAGSTDADWLEVADRRAQTARGHADDRMDIEQALTHLSVKLRSVVVLVYFQGLSQQDVADVLGIPLGTVKSRLFLAMEELREHLKP